jgi:hypothetical protein
VDTGTLRWSDVIEIFAPPFLWYTANKFTLVITIGQVDSHKRVRRGILASMKLVLDGRTFSQHIEPHMDRLLCGMLEVHLEAGTDNARAAEKQAAITLDVVGV